jgi:hypothetical protein
MSFPQVADSSYLVTPETFSPGVEKKEIEAQHIENQPTISPAESKKILEANEAMYKALVPNLRRLMREEIFNAKLEKTKDPIKRFYLIGGVLRLKVEAFKQEGGSLEELAEEMKPRIADKNFLPLEGKHSELKEEIFRCYASLMKLAYEMNAASSHFLKLYELEKEIGLVILGTPLLVLEALAYEQVRQDRDFFDLYRFLSNTALPNWQKIISYLEQENEIAVLEQLINTYIKSVFTQSNLKERLSWMIDDFHPTLLNQAMPYIVKYGAFDSLRKPFDEMAKPFYSWDKAYLWIDMNCQAAEIVAAKEPNKAAGYLAEAEKEMHDQLWSYYFSPVKKVIADKRKEAEERIAAAKAKIGQQKA